MIFLQELDFQIQKKKQSPPHKIYISPPKEGHFKRQGLESSNLTIFQGRCFSFGGSANFHLADLLYLMLLMG